MKKLPLLSALLIFAFGFGQTPITDSNFNQAIATCLSTNPIDGLCSDSGYGAMPDWDVSQVTIMSLVFEEYGTTFNGDIGSWDVSNVTNMYNMFLSANAFNQDIGSWDVSNVISMWGMFIGAVAFNQDISSWDVSNVTNMEYMFLNATSYNQDISSWSVDGVTDCTSFSDGATSWTLPQPNFTNCTP